MSDHTIHPSEDSTVCDMCFPGHRIIGKLGCLVLAVIEDKITILTQPCHRGDVILSFGDDTSPYPDPWIEDEHDLLEIDSSDPIWRASETWCEDAETFSSAFFLELESTNQAWYLVEDARKNLGYEQAEHGTYEMWLFDKMGVIVQEFFKKGQASQSKSVENWG